MVNKPNEMRALRPSVKVPQEFVAAGCETCGLIQHCGGMRNERALLTCVDQFCCGTGDCDNVCPDHPKYAKWVKEIGGYGSHRIGPMQQSDVRIPTYVPLVHHGYCRQSRLHAEAVAVCPYNFLKQKRRRYVSNVQDQESLRVKFKIADDAKLILCGTAKDKPLEAYWTHRRAEQTMDLIAAINPDLYIAPNFSMFLDVPRHDNLFNIKRQLLCLSELSAAGVSVVPHISATMPHDWDNWRAFLAEHTDIQHIAFNFQTGYSNTDEAKIALNRLVRLQQTLGRDLSLIMIGGSQFLEVAMLNFVRLTVIDSTPFMKTQHRQRLVMNGSKRHWVKSPTKRGTPIDDLLQQNVSSYSTQMAHRVGQLFN